MPLALPPVLVVDDEKNMRLSLQAMLGDEGYESRAVESAARKKACSGADSSSGPEARICVGMPSPQSRAEGK